MALQRCGHASRISTYSGIRIAAVCMVDNSEVFVMLRDELLAKMVAYCLLQP